MHTIGKCGGFLSSVCDAVLCGWCTIQIMLFYIILFYHPTENSNQ